MFHSVLVTILNNKERATETVKGSALLKQCISDMGKLLMLELKTTHGRLYSLSTVPIAGNGKSLPAKMHRKVKQDVMLELLLVLGI